MHSRARPRVPRYYAVPMVRGHVAGWPCWVSPGSVAGGVVALPSATSGHGGGGNRTSLWRGSAFSLSRRQDREPLSLPGRCSRPEEGGWGGGPLARRPLACLSPPQAASMQTAVTRSRGSAALRAVPLPRAASLPVLRRHATRGALRAHRTVISHIHGQWRDSRVRLVHTPVVSSSLVYLLSVELSL